ncbi:MAG: cell wall-binding repeat-containing protein [Candidatus Hydrothermarchaeales archaeon]
MKRIFLLALILFAMASAMAIESEYDAIIVRDDIPVDWIIAQAYSHKSGIPIVTTSPDKLDQNAKVQLEGYNAAGWNKLLIFGGENAVSPKIEIELRDMGFITHRISEVDRYGTSARVAIELYGSSEGCVIASGDSYEGLLVAARMATETEYPLLLIKGDRVPESVSDAMNTLGAKKVILISPGVSKEVVSTLLSSGFDLKVVETDIDVSRYRPFRPTKSMYLVLGIALGILSVFGAYKYRKAKEKVSLELLTEDEEKVIKAIAEGGGEVTQDILPEKTNFSRPKISRIVAGLVERDLISKDPYKKTQKLKIKKEFY